MPDLVVTCPAPFWLDWLFEGDAAGTPETGEEWAWYLGGPKPDISPGDRLYVVAHGHLRGWSPVTRVASAQRGWAICRAAGAVACTLELSMSLKLKVGALLRGAENERSTKVGPSPNGICRIDGFRGTRKRWWVRAEEVPFPNWLFEGVPTPLLRKFLHKFHATAITFPIPQVSAELTKREP